MRLLLLSLTIFCAGLAAAEDSEKPFGGPCDVYFKSLDRTSGKPGSTFKMLGHFGYAQKERFPVINRGISNRLEVVSWSDDAIEVRIPADLDPGKGYRVGIVCGRTESGKGYSTAYQDFEVLR
jgi:hypothetical protein